MDTPDTPSTSFSDAHAAFEASLDADPAPETPVVSADNGANVPETPVMDADAGTSVPETSDTGTSVPETPAAESFDRAYVEKLRDEAAKYRTQLREQEQNFEGWDAEDKALFLQISKNLLSDDPEAALDAARRLREVSDRVASQLGDAEKPMTKAEMQKFIEERDRERSVQESTARILETASRLGYERGSLEFAQLMWTAQNDSSVGGDIEKAHGVLQARADAARQAAIDAYVADKGRQAQAFPDGPSDGSAPGTSAEKPQTWDQARSALHSLLDASPGR